MPTKDRCLRCGGPAPRCGRLFPLQRPGCPPEPDQYHGTVFLVVVVSMVLAVAILIAHG